jgi:hypothetical protein
VEEVEGEAVVVVDQDDHVLVVRSQSIPAGHCPRFVMPGRDPGPSKRRFIEEDGLPGKPGNDGE